MDEWLFTCTSHLVLRVTPLTSQRQGALQEECITETFDNSLNRPSEVTRVPQHTLLFQVSAVSVYALN